MSYYQELQKERETASSRWMKKAERVFRSWYKPTTLHIYMTQFSDQYLKIHFELYRLYNEQKRIEFIWEKLPLYYNMKIFEQTETLDEPPVEDGKSGYMGAFWQEGRAKDHDPFLVFFLDEFETARLCACLPKANAVTGFKGLLNGLGTDFLL